jgi:hypothetical protein
MHFISRVVRSFTHTGYVPRASCAGDAADCILRVVGGAHSQASLFGYGVIRYKARQDGRRSQHLQRAFHGQALAMRTGAKQARADLCAAEVNLIARFTAVEDIGEEY